MNSSARSRLPGWLLGGSVIAVAMGVMNVTTYGFTMLAARVLGPSHYGALAAIMGLLLVINVVSLGIQATAARRVSATPQHTTAIEHDVLVTSYRSAVALGVLCLLATPVVDAVLHLDSWLTAALMAVTAVPLTVMGGQAGVLQGERRWGPLALVYLNAGVGRLLCGALGMLWRPDALGAMVGVALGAFFPTVVGWAALRRTGRERTRQSPAQVAFAHRSPRSLLVEVAQNSHALLAFFALSNADVVIARTVLDEQQAGLYAAGLILTKAVLFLPQFVVVVAFPAMAAANAGRDLHLKGVALVLGLGAAAVGAAALLPGLALEFVGGHQYGVLESRLWAFAALGTVLALLQVMVYNVVARRRQRTVYVIWAALALLACLAPALGSVGVLLVAVASVDVALFAVLLTLSLRPDAAQRPTPPQAVSARR